MLKYRYYRSQLNPNEQSVYDRLTETMERCGDEMITEELSKEEIHRIFSAVNLDQTQLFHVDYGSLTLWQRGDTYILKPSYHLSDKAYRDAKTRLRQTAETILNEMRRERPRDPFLFLHDRLIMNTVYGETEGREYDAHNIFGALVDGKCVCEGYAKAYRYLCTLADLQCTVIVGNADVPYQESGPHAWNMIRDQGHLYHVDVTFDHLIERKYCSRSYYKVSEQIILRDHSFDSLFKVPHAPHDGSLLKTVSGTRQLIDFMKDECYRGMHMSQVRLSRGFEMDAIIQKVESGLSGADYAWYGRLQSYHYAPGTRIISFVWERPSYR